MALLVSVGKPARDAGTSVGEAWQKSRQSYFILSGMSLRWRSRRDRSQLQVADYEQLLYRVSDGVATVALNRPEQRNALSAELLEELVDAILQVRDDDQVRALVLTGAGDKVFCAGADLGGFAADALVEALRLGPLPRLLQADARLGKPSLCAANGHVLAGGLGHAALSCDLVIAREGATFGTPEISIGAFPYMIMSIIFRNVPRKRA